MRVSGTPQSPKPPARTVELDFRSLMASSAEGRTLLISHRRTELENARARNCWCCNSSWLIFDIEDIAQRSYLVLSSSDLPCHAQARSDL